MKAVVVGFSGRLGKAIVAELQKRHHTFCGIDETTSGDCSDCDVVIDFSSPNALATVLEICNKCNLPLVCGTTGYTNEQKRLLNGLPSCVKKANFSQGFDEFANCCKELCFRFADWDKTLTEVHRQGKADTPSGSALALCKLLNIPKEKVNSIRLGNEAGTHWLTLTNGKEELTLKHRVFSTAAFAQGAVDEAEKLVAEKSTK